MSFRDVVKKSILFGLGAAVLTKEEIEDFVKDLQKDKDLTPEEGKKVVREVIAEAEKRLKKPNAAFKKNVEGSVKDIMKTIGVVTHKDLEILKKELETLKKEFGVKTAKPKTAAKKTAKKA